jgi:hypothetical protein
MISNFVFPNDNATQIRIDGLNRRIYNTERRLYNLSKSKVFTKDILELIKEERLALDKMKTELQSY